MHVTNDSQSSAFERPGTLLFLSALRAALSRPILWIATSCALVLFAGAPALAVRGFFEAAFDSGTADWRALRETGVAIGAESWTLSETFRQDHREGLAQLATSTSALLAALAAVALLLGVFAAGGWLQIVFERVEGTQFRRFCFGGARYFWRFLRVLVLVSLLLALVRWVFYGTPWKELVLAGLLDVPAWDLERLSTLESEAKAARVGWVRDGLAALAFALVLVFGAYTRTRLVLRDGRSVLHAGVATFFVMLRHPIQTLRPILLLQVVQALVVVAAAGWLVAHVESRAAERPRIEHVVALLAIVLAALLWRNVTRGATYFATARVSQHLVPPHKRKGDPWVVIGGPGGPQYPVGDEDDGYHVTM